MKLKDKMRKGQEEIIGLVIIVTVVMIVLLVFLTFILKNPAEINNEKELKNFIDSIVLYTTSCEQNNRLLDLKELIIACKNNEECSDGRSCDILDSFVRDILDVTKVNEEKISGQNVDIFYRYKDSTNILVNIKRGECLGNNTINSVENVYPADQGVVGLKIKECS